MRDAKSRFRSGFLCGINCACVIAFTGCATSIEPVPKPPRTNKGYEAIRPIQRISPKVLSVSQFIETRPIKLVVRVTKQGEVDSEWWEAEKKTLQLMAGGGGVGALAITSVPAVMGSAAILLGGVFLATSGALILGVEKERQEQMIAAVGQTNLPMKIQSVLSHRLHVADEQAADAPTLEVLTVSYGVVDSKRQQESFCVVAEMLLRLTVDGVERYTDRVLIYPELRSSDAPYPDCRTREVMAMQQGKVIRTTLEVYAEAMPALLQYRLPGLPWRN